MRTTGLDLGRHSGEAGRLRSLGRLEVSREAGIAFAASGPVGEALGGANQEPIALPSITPFVVAAFLGFFLGGFLLTPPSTPQRARW